jgi:hypothetical protein
MNLSTFMHHELYAMDTQVYIRVNVYIMFDLIPLEH